LCDNTLEGGYQYTPKQVGDMTLDQIFMLLADKKILRESKKMRTEAKMTQSIDTDKDEVVNGRDRKDHPIKAKKAGETYARRLKREAAEKNKRE